MLRRLTTWIFGSPDTFFILVLILTALFFIMMGAQLVRAT